jgi:pimeloyl-ACP methyl ester carboxylesterase
LPPPGSAYRSAMSDDTRPVNGGNTATGRFLIALALVVISLLVTNYIAAKPDLRDLISFYVWKAVSGKSHGGNYVESNNASIYYETFGSGPPVLVLHEGLGSLEDMGYQIRALADSHFVIAADSRGQGRSTDFDEPLSYTLMADDMYKLLDHLKISRTDIVGWSDGGVIGLDLAIRHPEVVGKLVAIGANFDSSGISKDLKVEPRMPLRYRFQPGDYNDWPEIYPKVVALWRTEPHYSRAELGKIKSPTLIMAGEFDVIKARHTDQLAQAIDHGEELIVPGATHSVPMEKPEIVDSEILKFLDRGKLK